MCPVRFVTYVPGRSVAAGIFLAHAMKGPFMKRGSNAQQLGEAQVRSHRNIRRMPTHVGTVLDLSEPTRPGRFPCPTGKKGCLSSKEK
jgi:hypothetical protein